MEKELCCTKLLLVAVELKLAGIALTGSIPSSIFDLTNLGKIL